MIRDVAFRPARPAMVPADTSLERLPCKGSTPAYVERQLAAFAQGMRQNDIFEQMQIIAKQLTPEEMHALAAFYGAPERAPVANK